jgi:hypothetical protein
MPLQQAAYIMDETIQGGKASGLRVQILTGASKSSLAHFPRLRRR